MHILYLREIVMKSLGLTESVCWREPGYFWVLSGIRILPARERQESVYERLERRQALPENLVDSVYAMNPMFEPFRILSGSA